MRSLFAQKDALNEEDLRKGRRGLIADAAFSQLFGALTGGAFLAAYALALGASNALIGLVAGAMSFAQVLQVPAIYLVETSSSRKRLVVLAVGLGRLSWIGIALVPWLLPPAWWIPALVACLLFFYSLNAISGCAFSSWMRDTIPERVMGRFMAERMRYSTAVGAVVSLAAGVAVKQLEDLGPTVPYSLLFLTAVALGLVGIFFLVTVPEPRPPVKEVRGLDGLLREPFRDPNFRQLLRFSVLWSFAVSMSGAFYAVYLLQRLGLAISWVVALGVLGKMVGIYYAGRWGRLIDRKGGRKALTLAGPLFILSIFLVPWTTLPEKYLLTLPLLVLIFALAGVSTVGVTLGARNLTLRAAPRGRSTAFLAVHSLSTGLAAAAGPLLGGLLADFVGAGEFNVLFDWSLDAGSGPSQQVSAFSLRGLDFVFLLSSILGLYALHCLAYVREPAAPAEEDGPRAEQIGEKLRHDSTGVSGVEGLGQLSEIPELESLTGENETRD